MGMIDQIIDFNKTSGTTRMEEYVPTLSRDCHDVPLLAKKRHRHKAMSSFGCPDGLEPSTFRTTSNLSISPIVPLFIDVCDFIENRVCVDFASISAPVIIFKILFQRTLVLLLENFLQFAFIRSF